MSIGRRDFIRLAAASPAAAMALARKAPAQVGKFPKKVVILGFDGANSHPEIRGVGALPGKSHYFVGNDPVKWRTNIAGFAKARYEALYPGVNLVFYGNQRNVAFDFILSPGSRPETIRMHVAGVDDVTLAPAVIPAGSSWTSKPAQQLRDRSP